MTTVDRLVLLWQGQRAEPADLLAVQRMRRDVRARLSAGESPAQVAGDLVVAAWRADDAPVAPTQTSHGAGDVVLPFRTRTAA